MRFDADSKLAEWEMPGIVWGFLLWLAFFVIMIFS